MERSAEEESQIPVEQLGVSSEVSPQTLSMIKDILDALAHEDAIKIFIYAKNGITNSTVAISDMGLTQKRYYTRLKLLLDAGILEKWEQGYRYTFLGTILHQMSGSFKAVLEQKDRLELANKLRKTKSLSEEEKKNLMTLITPTGSGGSLDLSAMVNPVRMVDNYEDLVKELTDMIERAEESVYIVTKYSDVRVMEAMIRALQRGIQVKALSEEQAITNRVSMLRVLLSPSMMKAVVSFAKEASNIVRKTNVSYSFILLDNKLAVIEVPHPIKDIFYLGFVFQNEDIIKKLAAIFNDIWEKAGHISV